MRTQRAHTRVIVCGCGCVCVCMAVWLFGGFVCGAVIKEGAAGRKSDVWSLGCTVIEMATGKAPWNEFTNPITAMVTIGNGPFVASIAGVCSLVNVGAHNVALHRRFSRHPHDTITRWPRLRATLCRCETRSSCQRP